MKFYTVEDLEGTTLGCGLTMHEAHTIAAHYVSAGEYTITCDEVAVSAESIRLLLARQGGYAVSTRRVFPRETVNSVT